MAGVGLAALLAACLIAPLLCAGADDTGAEIASVRVEPESPLFGEGFSLVVSLSLPRGAKAQVPEVAESAELMVKDAQIAETGSNASDRTHWRLTLVVRCFKAGKYQLPALEIPWRAAGGAGKTLSVPGPTVELRSRIPDTPPRHLPGLLKDVRGPLVWVKTGLDSLILLVVALYLAATVAVVALCRRTTEKGPGRAQSAIEAGLRSVLARLLEERAKMSPRDFYAEFSRAVRKYFGDASGLPIQCMTPMVIEERANLLKGKAAKVLCTLAEILGNADTIRFGSISPSQQDFENDVEKVISIYESLRGPQ